MNKNSIPLVKTVTDFSFVFIIFERFKVTFPVVIPRLEKFFLTLLKFSDKFNKLFEGMHPTLRQVPPSVFLDSIQAVLKPSCADRMAQT